MENIQLQMIEKVRQIALQSEDISAVLMYGSFTKGEGDQYSDIEFYIFHRTEQCPDKMGFVAQVAPVLLFFTNEFGTDVVVFDNLIRGEFHFHPASDVSIINSWQGVLNFSVRDNMNLVDKDGLLTETLGNIEQLHPEWNTPENITWCADSMINNLLFTGNVIRRGEYARATHLFFYLEKYLACLIRLHLGKMNHWLDPMKGLEQEIPPQWYEKYSKCIPQLNKESLEKCYAHTLNLVEELFRLLEVPVHYQSILERIKGSI